MAESDINQVLFPADWAVSNVLSAHLKLSRTPGEIAAGKRAKKRAGAKKASMALGP